ncbi:MAG TPA: VC0807 family protein, partial [Sphingomonas sp.]
LAWSIGGFAWNRRIDELSILAMAGIALSLLAFVGGGSARLLELREKMVTLVIGLAFLGSAAIGRPLIYPLARATMARRSQADADAFHARRDEAAVRHTVMVMTLVWGFGLLADVALSIVLIYALPVATYLVAGPILGYGAIGGLTLWTMLYRRRRERSRD